MKKILFIIPKLSYGGIEKVASQLSMGLSNNFEQVIISIMNQNDSYPFKVKPIIIDIPLGKTKIGKLVAFFKRLFYIWKIKRNTSPDICFSFGERCNLLNILTKHKGKTILSIHSLLKIENVNRGFYGKFYNFSAKYLYNNAEKIVVVSDGIGKDIRQRFKIDKQKFTRIYNPVDIQNIQHQVENSVMSNSQLQILSIGRITYAKGQWHLLRALSLVKNEFPNIKVKIIGSIEDKSIEKTLNKIVANWNLENNIDFISHVPEPWKYASERSIFVLTSIFEGFGNVIIESFAAGIPVLSTNCETGPREIFGIKDSPVNQVYHLPYGIVIPAFDGKILSDEPLLENEKLLAKEIINCFHSQYSKDILIEKAKEFELSKIVKQYEVLFSKI